MKEGDLTYMYRVAAPAVWAPGTVVHYSTASAAYDGQYLTADTEDALRNIMAAIGFTGTIEEYVTETEEDHQWVPAPDEGPAHQPLEGI